MLFKLHNHGKSRKRQPDINNVTESEPISTIEFNLEFPQQELPQCTIAQMLDLNNDGDVNAKDIKIIVDFIVGRPLSINSTKNCNALNLFIP